MTAGGTLESLFGDAESLAESFYDGDLLASDSAGVFFTSAEDTCPRPSKSVFTRPLPCTSGLGDKTALSQLLTPRAVRGSVPYFLVPDPLQEFVSVYSPPVARVRSAISPVNSGEPGTGSAVLLSPNLAITNYHVAGAVRTAVADRLRFHDRSVGFGARIAPQPCTARSVPMATFRFAGLRFPWPNVEVDVRRDFTLLRLDCDSQFGSAGRAFGYARIRVWDLEAGERFLMMGHRKGASMSVASCVVRIARSSDCTPEAPGQACLRFDTQPEKQPGVHVKGYSGSGLFDSAGFVRGINQGWCDTWSLSRGRTNLYSGVRMRAMLSVSPVLQRLVLSQAPRIARRGTSNLVGCAVPAVDLGGRPSLGYSAFYVESTSGHLLHLGTGDANSEPVPNVVHTDVTVVTGMQTGRRAPRPTPGGLAVGWSDVRHHGLQVARRHVAYVGIDPHSREGAERQLFVHAHADESGRAWDFEEVRLGHRLAGRPAGYARYRDARRRLVDDVFVYYAGVDYAGVDRRVYRVASEGNSDWQIEEIPGTRPAAGSPVAAWWSTRDRLHHLVFSRADGNLVHVSGRRGDWSDGELVSAPLRVAGWRRETLDLVASDSSDGGDVFWLHADEREVYLTVVASHGGAWDGGAHRTELGGPDFPVSRASRLSAWRVPTDDRRGMRQHVFVTLDDGDVGHVWWQDEWRKRRLVAPHQTDRKVFTGCPPVLVPHFGDQTGGSLFYSGRDGTIWQAAPRDGGLLRFPDGDADLGLGAAAVSGISGVPLGWVYRPEWPDGPEHHATRPRRAGDFEAGIGVRRIVDVN